MNKKRGRKSKKPNKDIFLTLYYNETTKAEELANTYAVTVQTIYNWANEFKKEQQIDK